MKWIRSNERNPKEIGVYGVTNKSPKNPLDFSLAFFDGDGWKIIQEADEYLSPYREPIYWCVLEFGKG